MPVSGRWEAYEGDDSGWGNVVIELPDGLGTLTIEGVNDGRDYFGGVSIQPSDALWTVIRDA